MSEPLPLGPGEARVRIAWAGMCRSDLGMFEGRRPAHLVRYPVTPGHEWSGHVDAVGDDVDASLIGRPVVGEGFRPCHACGPCRRGQTTLCEAEYDETGFTRAGAWAEYLTLPARMLHVLPDGADMEAAAVLEPAAVAGEAFLRAAPLPGHRVAIVGGGTVGLLVCQLFKAAGPAQIVVVDPRVDVTVRATRSGANRVVAVTDARDELARSFDVVVEAAGASGSAQLAVELVRPGGTVILIGIPADKDDHVRTVDLLTRQVTFHAVFGAPPRAWSHTVRAFSAGLINPGILVTHHLALDDAEQAFDLLRRPPADLGKILIRP